MRTSTLSAVTLYALTSAIAATVPALLAAQDSGASHPGAMFVKYDDVRWQPIKPELGERSPEISILHVDPTTHATKLMIRVPPDFYVPKHWHSGNETHTVLSGTFVLQSHGKVIELGPGSFNFMPARMVHEAWTLPNEGVVLFITVDAAWDVNFVDEQPTAELASKRPGR